MSDRSKFIGGSDVSAILGVSPYKTPLDLYLDKIDPKEDNRNAAAKNRGKRLEPYVLDMLSEEHGFPILARNKRYDDRVLPYLSAEIDAETLDTDGKRVNVEIKTVHPFKRKEWGEELTDEIPVHYTAQAMHGLMLSGRDRCIFAVLIGDELRLYRVDRDVEIMRVMREREVAFWTQNVIPRIPPAPSNSLDVLKLFEKDIGTSIEATQEIANLCERLKTLRAIAKETGAQIEDAEEAIKLFMGGAARLEFNAETLATWKTQAARRLDQSALAAAHPTIVEEFKRVQESRVFRLR